MRAAIASGALRPPVPADRASLFQTPGDAPAETPALLGTVGSRCVFFDEDAGRLCRVQRALGHDALPLACRQFPRVVVRDPRGISVVLSHYCPTAAALLDNDSDATVSIVEAPAAFPTIGEYDGLDTRGSLPPLLRPDVLMDWESWWEFERMAIGLLANSDEPPATSIGRLAHAIEHARNWHPGDGALIDRVRDAFDRAGRRVSPTHAIDVRSRRQEIIGAMPHDVPFSEAGVAPARRLARFLAAHAFANWTAHLGGGLRTWLRSVEAAYALVASGCDVRKADLRLRHLGDPNHLAETWSAAEGRARISPRRRLRRGGRASQS